VDLTLHIEEFAFIRDRFRKNSKKEKLLYKADGSDQFLKRNQVYARKNYSLWEWFKQVSLVFKDKVKLLDDVQPEVKELLCNYKGKLDIE